MSTNLQDQILLAELNNFGVVDVNGTSIAQPLTSPFTDAVAAAVLLDPPVLAYTGQVTGWDFVYGGTTLVLNLSKLNILTITGNVSSAFNDMSLKIKQLNINGGVNNSFQRFKLCGNMTVNGDIMNSFLNVVLEQGSQCGQLILNGNIGMSTAILKTQELYDWVAAYVVAVPPTTLVPTVADFTTAYNAFYANLILNYTSPDADLVTTNANIVAYLGGLTGTDPFTAVEQAGVLAEIVFSTTPVPSFQRIVLKYDTIKITSDNIYNSIYVYDIYVRNLLVTIGNAISQGDIIPFMAGKIRGVSCSEAESVSFVVNQSTSFPLGLTRQFLVLSKIVANSFSLTGSYTQAIRSCELITKNIVLTNSVSSSANIVFSSYVKACDTIDIDALSSTNFTIFDRSSLEFKNLILRNSIENFIPLKLSGHKLIYYGKENFVGNFFSPSIVDVEYICLDKNVQTARLFVSSVIDAKEMAIHSDLISSTSMFVQGVLTAKSLIFHKGFINNNSTPNNMNFVFNVETVSISDCGVTGIILSQVFNGSLLELHKLLVSQDTSLAFNASTIVADKFVTGASLYTFGQSLVVVKDLRLEVEGTCGPVQKPLVLYDDDPGTSFGTLGNIIEEVIGSLPVTYNTTFVSESLRWSAFNRSTLTHIMYPKFVDFDITVFAMQPLFVGAPAYASYQFLLDAINSNRLEATIVNGDTQVVLSSLQFAQLAYLKLVGTATVTSVPASVLKSLEDIKVCTTVPITSGEKCILKKYKLVC
mgnify:CR=1 FL=1